MVLIKPFFQAGSLDRQRKRDHLSLCITAPYSVPCTYLRDLEPWIPSRNQAMKTPDTIPSSLGKETRRQAESMERGGGGASLSIPRDLPLGGLPVSTQHCLKTTAASSRSPEHTCISIPALRVITENWPSW